MVAIFGIMIIAWKVVVKKIIIFQDVSVLACYDYCVKNEIEQKRNIKPVYKNVTK